MAKPNPFTVISNPDAITTPRIGRLREAQPLPVLGAAALRPTTGHIVDKRLVHGPLVTEIDGFNVALGVPSKVDVGYHLDVDALDAARSLNSGVISLDDFFSRQHASIDLNAARLRESLGIVRQLLGSKLGSDDASKVLFCDTDRLYIGEYTSALVAYDALKWLEEGMSRGADAKPLPESAIKPDFVDEYPSKYWSLRGVAERQKLQSIFQTIVSGLKISYDTDDRQALMDMLYVLRSEVVVGSSGIPIEQLEDREGFVGAAWAEYIDAHSGMSPEIPPAS